MQSTIEYFNKTKDELAEIKNEFGYTKEDNLILDDGLDVPFFDSEEGLESFTLNNIPEKLEIKKTLKTIDDRYALILN